jgi:uncharacterized membrane protein SpoIIM required for sporulation
MKQQQFEAEHAALWDNIGNVLNGAGHRETLPELYRQLCQSLALAIQRGYAPALTDYLQTMVADCHKRLYGSAAARPATLLRWISHDFPRQVRAEWRLLLLACIANIGVALLVGWLVWDEPYRAYSFMSGQELEKYRAMYQPGSIAKGRAAGGDAYMFGRYIWNNVSLIFINFAGGVMGGVPALLSMGREGIHTGVIAAWLSRDPGSASQFWPFFVTHTSFEITGMLLSATAGMRLGLSLIKPGRMTRRDSLQAASIAIFPVIIGAALMTFLAAFFEAVWSASPSVTPQLKFIVGGICWTSVICYFLFAGRYRR